MWGLRVGGGGGGIRTREVVVEADPGQEVMERHADALQADRARLQVPRLQQFRVRVAGETPGQSENSRAQTTTLEPHHIRTSTVERRV